MHTEAQAQKLRCCGPDGCGGWVRTSNDDSHTPVRYCIASECMAWRWGEPAPDLDEDDDLQRREWFPEDVRSFDAEPQRPPEVPATAKWVPFSQDDHEAIEGGYWTESDTNYVTRVGMAVASRRGFCGLAVRPDVA
jgi:hypothetical protein